MIVLMGFMDRALDFLGLIYFATVLVKITKGYPVKRWFF